MSALDRAPVLAPRETAETAESAETDAPAREVTAGGLKAVAVARPRPLFRWGRDLRTAAGVRPVLSAFVEYLNWREVAGLSNVRSQFFAAYDDTGRTVGRVAITLDGNFLQRYGPCAFFGAFDAQDDPAVARCLLQAGMDWSRPFGVHRLLGPITYTTADLVGIEGRDANPTPTPLCDAVPGYYQELLVAAGCRPADQMSCYRWVRADHDGSPGLAEFLDEADAIVANRGYVLRDGDMDNLHRELEGLRVLYNTSFAQTPLAVPLAMEVFDKQAAVLRRIVPPGYTRVVEHDGEPVAFLVMVPELAEVTRLDGLGLARFASRRLANRSVLRHGRAACVLIIGVDPRHRGGGLGLVLTAEMVRMVERFGLEAFTTTFVHEANHATLALTRRLELEPVRSLRLFAFGEPDPGDVRP